MDNKKLNNSKTKLQEETRRQMSLRERRGLSPLKISVVESTLVREDEELLMPGNSNVQSQIGDSTKNLLRMEYLNIPLNIPRGCVVSGCSTKNRYHSILPNEETRVKLIENDDHSLDAYINANYIRGCGGEEKAFIATQGPLPNTIVDFYRMVWNERSPIIVMITKIYEGGKIKCASYFPIEIYETSTYGDFRVTVISVAKKDGFSVRELLVQSNCVIRRILHYWYDSWPDHDIPDNTHSIVTMVMEIEKSRKTFKDSLDSSDSQSGPCGPVIVHCSAGIGRTGCFIAISLAITQLLKGNKVDILGIVCQMRCDRGGMIQTPEQYEFVHRVVALFKNSLPGSSAE